MVSGEYTGYILDGKPEDPSGTFIWANGSKYIGSWKNGAKNGQGTTTYFNGDTYVGEWKNGVHSGQGTYNWLNGGKYAGEWKNGKRHGYGTSYNADGTIRQQGQWQDGGFVG